MAAEAALPGGGDTTVAGKQSPSSTREWMVRSCLGPRVRFSTVATTQVAPQPPLKLPLSTTNASTSITTYNNHRLRLRHGANQARLRAAAATMHAVPSIYKRRQPGEPDCLGELQVCTGLQCLLSFVGQRALALRSAAAGGGGVAWSGALPMQRLSLSRGIL